MNNNIVVLTGLLAACAGRPAGVAEPGVHPESVVGEPHPGPDAPELEPEDAYESARARVAVDLEALEALQLVEVEDIALTDAMKPGNCYGVCPDDEARMARYVEQAERLHALVDLAHDDVDAFGPCYTRASDIVDQSVAAIEALAIVELGDLVLEEAAPDPNCYNLPCGDELARVEEINERRALTLFHLAERARDL
jgi:hypothetical protein